MSLLLLFLEPGGAVARWLRIDGAAVAARGEGAPPPPDPADPLRIAAVAPGGAVSLHWLDVPGGLAPAQAAAAARLAAAEVSAQPLAEMHVAVGREREGDALRPVAIVPMAAMAGWLAQLEAAGIDPHALVPEPLLLPRPDEGFVRTMYQGVPLTRGQADAFSVEPELEALIVGDAPVRTVGLAEFEAGFGAAAAEPELDLRQGPFARRRAWKLDRALVRRLVLTGLLILLVSLLIQVAAILRTTFAADEAEAELQRIGGAAPEPVGGGGIPYSAAASAVFGAVRDTANAELSAIVYEGSGSLRATVMADSPATLAALEQRIEAAGFDAEPEALRSGGGRPTADITVRMR